MMKVLYNTFVWTAIVASECSAFQVLPNIQPRHHHYDPYCMATTITEDIITTGPDGKAALNFEEDLRLTLKIIMDHEQRSTTVSKEQFVQQVAAAAALDVSSSSAAATIDISIPYDAPARLAYETEGSTMSYAEYKEQYESKAVADVMSKQKKVTSAVQSPSVSAGTVDIKVPYDAAAKLAYDKMNDASMDYNKFKEQYESKAVADVIAKKSSVSSSPPATMAPPSQTKSTDVSSSSTSSYDISVPYDAAAKVAYESLSTIHHSLSYETFKVQYEQNAVTNVIMKKNKRDNVMTESK